MGGTLLYDAVFLASDELMKKPKGRKALIILSDGVDHGSKETLDNAIKSAHLADTLVYSILFADQKTFSFPGGYGGPHQGGRRGGMGWPGGGGMGRPGGGGSRFPQQSHEDGKKVLERLSQQTGGGFYAVSKKMSITQIYSQIEEDLRNQYSLGYTPNRENLDPGYHKISLVTKQKDYHVLTRDGYYVPQQPSSAAIVQH
jgi:VWFA-related protein